LEHSKTAYKEHRKKDNVSLNVTQPDPMEAVLTNDHHVVVFSVFVIPVSPPNREYSGVLIPPTNLTVVSVSLVVVSGLGPI